MMLELVKGDAPAPCGLASNLIEEWPAANHRPGVNSGRKLPPVDS
jgi:hypothetical protein